MRRLQGVVVSDIRAWLESIGLAQHASVFIDNDVDLDALPHLTEAMLKEMGLSIGVRAKVMAGIKALKDEPLTSGGASEEDAGASLDERPRGARDAERRHLTVMFCDLVGSTALAEAMDPEDLRALIGSYQAAARTVIERYDGNIAQYLGDTSWSTTAGRLRMKTMRSGQFGPRWIWWAQSNRFKRPFPSR